MTYVTVHTARRLGTSCAAIISLHSAGLGTGSTAIHRCTAFRAESAARGDLGSTHTAKGICCSASHGSVIGAGIRRFIRRFPGIWVRLLIGIDSRIFLLSDGVFSLLLRLAGFLAYLLSVL